MKRWYWRPKVHHSRSPARFPVLPVYNEASRLDLYFLCFRLIVTVEQGETDWLRRATFILERLSPSYATRALRLRGADTIAFRAGKRALSFAGYGA